MIIIIINTVREVSQFVFVCLHKVEVLKHHKNYNFTSTQVSDILESYIY